MCKKRIWLTIGIILLFIGTCVLPSIAQNTEKSQLTSRGNWLYVGGSGPGNYTKIQDAINNSSPGDTVYVYRGTYHEAPRINVENLNVIGEGKEITIIDANSTTAVTIQKSFILFQGFTVKDISNLNFDNGIHVFGELHNIKICNNNLSINSHGIRIDGHNNYDVIENNLFYSNFYGITLDDFNTDGHCVIRNNTFVNNYEGLYVGGLYSEISNNTFFSCRHKAMSHTGGFHTIRNNIFIGNAIGLQSSYSGNSINGNYFINNNVGLSANYQNSIIGNHFENNGVGLFVGPDNEIHQKNFIKNRKHATFSDIRSNENNWDYNYWGISYHIFGYKFIFGKMQTQIKKIIQFNPYHTDYYSIPWVKFDEYPQQEPYDIGGKG